VVVGLQIASFTYGGLLGLFILSKMKRQFKPVSLIVGLVASLLIVFVLKWVGLAWTWFILCSVITNILLVYLTDIMLPDRMKAGHQGLPAEGT